MRWQKTSALDALRLFATRTSFLCGNVDGVNASEVRTVIGAVCRCWAVRSGSLYVTETGGVIVEPDSRVCNGQSIVSRQLVITTVVLT